MSKKLLIVGGGPAGLAVAVQANRLGYKDVQVVDPNGFGGGSLSKITDVTSNSPWGDVLEPYEDDLQIKTIGNDQSLSRTEPVPLFQVGGFLNQVGSHLTRNGLARHIQSHALCLRHKRNGWELQTNHGVVEADIAVIATGATGHLLADIKDRNMNNTFTSKQLFTQQICAELDTAIALRPVVAIIGDSHSAYSAALKLLNQYPKVTIDIYKKRETKIYFKDATEAEKHGYLLTARDSVCPDTGQINRFNGIRGAAKQLFLEERAGLHAHRIRSHIGVDIEEIDANVAIIQCTGYSPNLLQLLDDKGTEIPYEEVATSEGYSRLHAHGNAPVARIASIGLGHSSSDGTNVYHPQARSLLLSE